MTDASPLTRFEVRSRDPDLSHRLLRDAYTDFTVRLSGNVADFAFSHAGVTTPGCTAGRIGYGTTARLDVTAPQESLIVATRIGGEVSVDPGHGEVRPDVGEPLLMPTDTGWRAAVSGVTLDAVTLARPAVDRAARSAFGVSADDLTFSSVRPVSPATARYWRGVLATVAQTVLADDEVAASPLVLGAATRSLATAVLVTFPNSGLARADEHPEPVTAQPAMLRRALAFIDEHAGEDIGVDDIAAAARIGVRGLQHAFRRHRGRTPVQELHRVRMARAHADLQAADPTRGDTVAAVALRWGFSHPGRFSVRYRQVYGSSPSDTLRR